MCKSFYTVLFSAVLLVVALSFASTVAAQESTSEETTMMAADADDPQVDAETDNVSVEVDNGKVSAKTDNVSTSNETSSQQSSLTVQQNQADEGSGSEANTGDVTTDQQATTQATTRLNGKTVRFEDTGDDDFPDEAVISGLRDCTTEGSETVRVTVRQALSGQDPIQVEFTGDEVDVSSTRIVITGPDVDNFEVGNGRVESSSGIRCGSDNDNNRNRNNRNRFNNRNRNNDNRNTRIIRINRDNDDNLGAARRQYDDTKVIVDTIPDKGRLADTGGLPLAGVAVVALASVGLGLSILRSATRRDP